MVETDLIHNLVPTVALGKKLFKNTLIFEHDFIVSIKTKVEFKVIYNCEHMRHWYCPGHITADVFLCFWLTMVVLRNLSLSPHRPDTILSSRPVGLVPTRNFPDKLRYRRRAALGEDRLADLRVGAGWCARSLLSGCVILAVSALEEARIGKRREGWRKRADYDIWFSKC